MGREWTPLLRATHCLLALTLSVVAMQAQAAAPASPRKAGDIVVETGSTQTYAGRTVSYELGTLFVPENRAAPNSRLIGVGFARIRAARPTQEPPIVMLAGGPGVTLLDTFSDNGVAARRRLDLWLQFSAAVDVVIIDQRGYSMRGEVLEFTTAPQPLDRPHSVAAYAETLAKAAHAAVAAHPGKDLAGYTVLQCAEDVNDLRRALGYSQVTLYGASFGSQWGFAVMRLRPEIVARALLTDVEPLNSGYDMPSHVLAALQRIAWDADRDAGLAPYLPKGGLMAAVRAVRERLARGPVQVKVQEATGKPRTVTLGLEDFQDSLVRPAATWPAFVLSLYHRHYDDWAREVLQQRTSQEPSSLIGPLIDTSLGVSAEREHLLRTDPGTEFLGLGGFHSYIASAPAWPTPDVGDAFRLPVPSPIPVLFLHGDWDTSTPIENLVDVLPYFPNSRTLRVHRGTHGNRSPLREQHPELWTRLVGFLATGDTRDLPVDVTLSAPVFQQPSFPAPTRPAK